MEKLMAQSKSVRKESVCHLRLETLQAIKGVEKLVHGCQVSLAMASEFSKKHWNIFSEIVKDHATKTSPDTYRLSERLLNATGHQLLELRKVEKTHLDLGYKPSDILVMALCKAAQDIGPPKEEPDESSGYWLSGEPIWGMDHPISEAWTGLGKLPVPWELDESLQFDAKTKEWMRGPVRLGAKDADELCKAVRAAAMADDKFESLPPAPDYTDRFVVRICRSFEKRRTHLPKLTIEVEGVPVCDEVSKGAVELTDAIVEWIRYSIGPRKTRRGRPSTGKGAEAAFLHDHKGLSWAQVAHRLCPKDESHISNPQGNYRKQADQYWKRLRKKFRLPK